MAEKMLQRLTNFVKDELGSSADAARVLEVAAGADHELEQTLRGLGVQYDRLGEKASLADWGNLRDGAYDIIVGYREVRRVEAPWEMFPQLSAKLRPGAKAKLFLPMIDRADTKLSGAFRYLPKGVKSLAKLAGLEVLSMHAVRDSLEGELAGDFCDCELQRPTTAEPTLQAADIDESPAPVAAPAAVAAVSAPRPNVRHHRNPLDNLPPPNYYHFQRPEVIELIQNNQLQPKRVLELGCSAGAMGKQLKGLLGIEHYVGLELSPEAANLARSVLDEVHIVNVEQTSPLDLGLHQNPFDMLVCLDVLEHLSNPWRVLAELAACLRPGGHLVVSLPNIQNISVLINLTKGQFAYEPAGLLDATHLRFFCLQQINDLILGAGLRIKDTQATINPSVNMEQFKELDNTISFEQLTLKGMSKNDAVRFFVYQYLMVAEKPTT